MRRTQLIRAAFAITPLLLVATCTSSDECAASNPLMPVCFDPAPAEPRVAFMRAWDSTWARADLYTMNSDGTNLRRLTTDGMRNVIVSPAWSPDGKWIAFSKRADSTLVRSQIHAIAADGSTLRNLSNQTTAFDWSPAWSPDGDRIVFQSDRHNPTRTNSCCVTSIYVMDADGSNVQRLTSGWNDKLPRWSPDGSTIVFMSNRSGGNQIFVMNVDGSNIRQLTTEGTSRRPVWSPDGTRIAFEGTRDTVAGGMGSGIYVMNADGSGSMNVSRVGAMTMTLMDMNAAWSSDGRNLFFCSGRDSSGKMHVYAVASMGGGEVRRITEAASEDCCPDIKLPRRPGGAAMRR
jgi:TolB protein